MASSYEPYSIEVDPHDSDYEDWILTSVEPFDDGSGWSVLCNGSGCLVPAITEERYGRVLRQAVEPKIGDRLRVYGSLGWPLHGQVLNGVVVWYRTEAQQALWRQRQVEDISAQDERAFVLNKPKLDAQFEALSRPFQERLARFRAEDPTFRERSESYESFICQQADLLVRKFSTAHEVEELTNDQIFDTVDGWSKEHSGNTHGTAIALACAVLSGEQI